MEKCHTTDNHHRNVSYNKPSPVSSYQSMVSSKRTKKKFQILAHTDSLTNIYNRYGFDEFAEKMIQKNPNAHFVAASLISMISSLLMISMDIITETGH